MVSYYIMLHSFEYLYIHAYNKTAHIDRRVFRHCNFRGKLSVSEEKRIFKMVHEFYTKGL